MRGRNPLFVSTNESNMSRTEVTDIILPTSAENGQAGSVNAHIEPVVLINPGGCGNLIDLTIQNQASMPPEHSNVRELSSNSPPRPAEAVASQSCSSATSKAAGSQIRPNSLGQNQSEDGDNAGQRLYLDQSGLYPTNRRLAVAMPRGEASQLSQQHQSASFTVVPPCY